jgi:hypothetical protein
VFAKLFGVEPTKGSGNLWFAKLDVGDGAITFSCKWTSKPSFSVTKDLLREADNAVYQNGDNSIPALAISVDNGAETLVVLRASDLLRILASDSAQYIVPTKAAQKRAKSLLPGILRDIE